MTHEIEALSISWRAARALRRPEWSGEVLAVHARSCYLASEDGEIFAIVQQPLGNGPFSVVIPAAHIDLLHGLSLGAAADGTGESLVLGEAIQINLGGAALWDPKAYPGLSADEPALSRCLVEAHRAAATLSPATSLARLLPHLQDEDLPETLQRVSHFPRSHALIAGLADALGQRNRRSLKVVTSSLAGLGPGLTPSGDDFLAGVLVALALAHEHRPDAVLVEIAALLTETAAPRTNEISAAYLRAAHAGEVTERWHPLIAAIASGHAAGVGTAAGAVMEVGETSGADMLAGFLTGIGAIYGIPPVPWPDAVLPAVGAQSSEATPPQADAPRA